MTGALCQKWHRLCLGIGMAQQSEREMVTISELPNQGFDGAEHAETKARLAACIADEIGADSLTQAEAAVLLGVDQPKVSRLMHGQLAGFSTPRLLRFLLLLGRNVDIVVHPRQCTSPHQVGQLRIIAHEMRA